MAMQLKTATCKIEFVASQGVLITNSDKQILIHALLKKKFDYLGVLPDVELSKIKNAQGIYSDIDIILTTHIHDDHFNAELNGNHFANNTKARFLAS